MRRHMAGEDAAGAKGTSSSRSETKARLQAAAGDAFARKMRHGKHRLLQPCSSLTIRRGGDMEEMKHGSMRLTSALVWIWL